MGNLPYSTTSDDLATLFARVGAVTSAQVIMDRETGRSRGFGFVEMSDEDGRKAITELAGADMGGRGITVNEARPRQAAHRRRRWRRRRQPPLLTANSSRVFAAIGVRGARLPRSTYSTDGYSGLVMAPVSAPCTKRAYLPSTPVV